MDTDGQVIGLDFCPTERSVLGASFSGTSEDMNVADQIKGGLLTSSLWSAYGGLSLSGNTYVASVLTYGRTESESLRAIDLGSHTRDAYSLHDSEILAAVAETGRTFAIGDWSSEVFGSLEYITLREEGFQEQGAHGINLMVDPYRSQYLTSVVGLRLGKYFQDADQDTLWMVQANAGWLHDFDIDSEGITARFESAPESAFTIDDEREERDGLRLGGAVTFMLDDRLGVSARVNADLYSDESNLSGLFQAELNF